MLFLAYTGVRFGEMAALRVGRLDLAASRAVIAESVTPVQGQGLVWGTPKTHQRREVPIPRFLVDDLAGHVAGKAPDDLVFGGIRRRRAAAGQRVPYARSLRRRRPSACPICTRTSCGTPPPSLAIASGADVKVVQQMLGHGSATMTLDTYGHLFEHRLDEVADAMDLARTTERAQPAVARVSPEQVPPDPSPHGSIRGPSGGGPATNNS